MTLFQEGNTVSNNKLIFPLALKTIIIKYSKYNFKQYIHIHNEIAQSFEILEKMLMFWRLYKISRMEVLR
jgi:hypothetical protein